MCLPHSDSNLEILASKLVDDSSELEEANEQCLALENLKIWLVT